MGSTFTVTIPVIAIHTPSLPAERKHPTEWREIGLECPPAISGLRVLVVDDDPDTCELIRAVLEQCGGIVQTAHDAEGALDLFRSGSPSILVADIGMPEVDGYELIRRIRQAEGPAAVRTPAIALTAFARVEDRMKALASGYQMHVAKPVEPAELLTIIASLVGLINST